MWTYNYNIPPDELKHYASKYYDPVEAHEYYEKHKQLKGRKKASTSTLNEEGRSAASYVKEKIDAEREEMLAQEAIYREAYKQELQKVKMRTMEEHNKIMNDRISSISKLVKRMTPQERKKNGPKIRALIARLREENAAKRAAVEEQFKAVNVEISEESKLDRQAIREYSKNAYEEELEKMNKESNWKKPTNRRS